MHNHFYNITYLLIMKQTQKTMASLIMGLALLAACQQEQDTQPAKIAESAGSTMAELMGQMMAQAVALPMR